MWSTAVVLIISLLIDKQDNRNFRTRELASHQLEVIGKSYSIIEHLKKAKENHASLEIRRRCNTVYYKILDYKINEYISGKKTIATRPQKQQWKVGKFNNIFISYAEAADFIYTLKLLDKFENKTELILDTIDPWRYNCGANYIRHINFSSIKYNPGKLTMQEWYELECVQRGIDRERFLKILEECYVDNNSNTNHCYPY